MEKQKFDKKNNRILIVDDTVSVQEDFARVLSPNNEFFNQNNDSFDSFLASGEDVETVDTKPKDNKDDFNFELTFASQGEDALKLVKDSLSKKLPYSLVFMDVRMPPGWDGMKTLEEIFKIDDNIQAVISSAYSDYSSFDLKNKFNTAIDRILFLRKPFDSQEILQLAASLTKKWDLAFKNKNYIIELEKALNDIKTLKKFIPICAKCRKMKDGENKWYNFEEFLRDNTNYVLSHGFCPDCAIDAKNEIKEFKEKLRKSRIID